jgi:hypothetical protein
LNARQVKRKTRVAPYVRVGGDAYAAWHDYDEILPPEQDIKKFPQRSVILGDELNF